MMAAQHGREAEAAARKQDEVDMTARVAAETLRRMEVLSCDQRADGCRHRAARSKHAVTVRVTRSHARSARRIDIIISC